LPSVVVVVMGGVLALEHGNMVDSAAGRCDHRHEAGRATGRAGRGDFS